MQATKTKRADPVTINKDFINKITFPSPEEGRRVRWDKQLKGFGVRVNPNHSVVFIVQYRMKEKGSKTQTITIGRYGSPWSPDAARAKARALLEQIHHGIDPIAAKRQAEEPKERPRSRRATTTSTPSPTATSSDM